MGNNKMFTVLGVIILLASLVFAYFYDVTVILLGLIGFATCTFFANALDLLEKIRNSNKKLREMMETQLNGSTTTSDAVPETAKAESQD